jgi:signal transduction histidine kinase
VTDSHPAEPSSWAEVWPRSGLLASRAVQILLGSALAAGLYYGSAKLGYVLEFAGPVAAIVWLPVGVGIAFLYLGGLEFWPGILAGDLLANDYHALPVGSALGQTAGNMLEMVVAVLLLREAARRGPLLRSVAGVCRVLVALAVAVAISAFIGGLANRLGSVVDTDQLPRVWRTWWLGDFTGALVVVPLALAWVRPWPRAWSRARLLEGAAVLAVVVGLTEVAFRSPRPVTYLVFPALIWAALRFTQRGATLTVALAAGLTAWNTSHDNGPFAYHSFTHSVLAVQLYIAVAALTTLFLAAVVSEREEYARGLQASRVRLLEAADTHRRRVERDLHDGAQQRLAALAYHLSAAVEQARRDPEHAPALFEEADTQLSLAIAELRELAHGIHPAVLTDLGLSNAIRSLASRSAVQVEVVQLPSTRVHPTVEATAYHVVAEAVANAEQHTGASLVGVRVAVDRGVVRIEVTDDGTGGAGELPGPALQVLRDRVEAIGGTLRIDSAPGRGTQMSAVLPAHPVRVARRSKSTRRLIPTRSR